MANKKGRGFNLVKEKQFKQIKTELKQQMGQKSMKSKNKKRDKLQFSKLNCKKNKN